MLGRRTYLGYWWGTLIPSSDMACLGSFLIRRDSGSQGCVWTPLTCMWVKQYERKRKEAEGQAYRHTQEARRWRAVSPGGKEVRGQAGWLVTLGERGGQRFQMFRGLCTLRNKSNTCSLLVISAFQSIFEKLKVHEKVLRVTQMAHYGRKATILNTYHVNFLTKLAIYVSS